MILQEEKKARKKIDLNLNLQKTGENRLLLLLLRRLPAPGDDRRSSRRLLPDLPQLPALLPRRDPPQLGLLGGQHPLGEEERDARCGVAGRDEEHRRLEPDLLLEERDGWSSFIIIIVFFLSVRVGQKRMRKREIE